MYGQLATHGEGMDRRPGVHRQDPGRESGRTKRPEAETFTDPSVAIKAAMKNYDLQFTTVSDFYSSNNHALR